MDRKVRNILIAVGIVILILVTVPFLIPVNQFKPTIETKASAALGRPSRLATLVLSPAACTTSLPGGPLPQLGRSGQKPRPRDCDRAHASSRILHLTASANCQVLQHEGRARLLGSLSRPWRRDR